MGRRPEARLGRPPQASKVLRAALRGAQERPGPLEPSRQAGRRGAVVRQGGRPLPPASTAVRSIAAASRSVLCRCTRTSSRPRLLARAASSISSATTLSAHVVASSSSICCCWCDCRLSSDVTWAGRDGGEITGSGGRGARGGGSGGRGARGGGFGTCRARPRRDQGEVRRDAGGGGAAGRRTVPSSVAKSSVISPGLASASAPTCAHTSAYAAAILARCACR